MKNSTAIPIVVGVTGHRNLRPEDIPALQKQVKNALRDIKEKCPHTPLVMLNSLAAGADVLCARVAVEMGISLWAALPMEEADYRRDFSPEEDAAFTELMGRAEKIFVAPDTEMKKPERDFHYRQAGIYVASHSHVLLALWDGAPGKDGGCGTAETVDFALRERYEGGNLLRSFTFGAVWHIVTPRAGAEDRVIETCLLENIPGSTWEVLQKTDEFNKEAAGFKGTADVSVLPPESMDGSLREMQDVYSLADGMSLKRQRRSLWAFALFAAFSVALVILYLIYDEAGMRLCLPIYGGVMALYALCYRLVGSRNLERYVQYRSLAEAMRIQMYLYAAGCREAAFDGFTWTQRQDALWVSKAVQALGVDGVPDKTDMDAVKAIWLDGQRDYHQHALKKDGRKLAKQSRITKAMLCAVLIMWVLVSVLEWVFPDLAGKEILTLPVRNWMAILWGSLSAVTVFAASFYGKLSLERKCTDHEKMAVLFEKAAEAYDACPEQRQELFMALAREELIENGNWVSYCLENKPDFSL